MPFEELNHTADIMIRVRAATLNELFSETAKAMFTIMFHSCTDSGYRETIVVDGADQEELLHNFLSDLLYISETKGIVFCQAIVTIVGTSLQAICTGEPFDPKKHSTGTEIKGISYSGLRIYKEQEDYVLDIIFDV